MEDDSTIGDAASAVTFPTLRTELFDPSPEIECLRRERPICRMRYPDGHLGWLVTSYSLAREVLADRRFSITGGRAPIATVETSDLVSQAVCTALPDLDRHVTGVLNALDPPEHTHLRRSQAGRFSVRAANDDRIWIAQLVEESLDAMEREGRPADLIGSFAEPLAGYVICHLIGVPGSEREVFQRAVKISADPNSSAGDVASATVELHEYVRELVAEKQARPQDDLISHLAADGLSSHELEGVAAVLCVAGHDTTANMVGLGVFSLLCGGSWATLLTEPSLIPGAVEELLRYHTPFQLGSFSRQALEDVEIGGVIVNAGESVTVSLAAANRDARQFPDPDRLDVTRDARGHRAFGHGRHICIGQHLARVELEEALRGLLRRFPGLCLAAPTAEVAMESFERFGYGVRELPVTW